jgi:hypothetical protein
MHNCPDSTEAKSSGRTIYRDPSRLTDGTLRLVARCFFDALRVPFATSPRGAASSFCNRGSPTVTATMSIALASAAAKSVHPLHPMHPLYGHVSPTLVQL